MITGKRLLLLAAAGSVAGLALFAHLRRAEACGCFAPPDPSVPIVQAGENILFSIEDGVVTAHIQIQYSGPAEQFGWLLPLPSVPDIDVGTDELFAQLIQTTQPKYRLNAEYVGDCPFDPNRSPGSFGGAGSPNSDSEGGGGSPDPGSPLVLRSSVGPFDYAVLRADSKQPMLDWLDENDFFVPAGTEDVIDPYIHPGGYFVAVKLLKGNDVGDIQPIVVKYDSDLPMIPIVLTSVAADPDMGIQVWMLGESRAIPRNYYHTEINDAKIDWLSSGQNYAQVVTDAVDEADGHHSFVTEYAGASSVMKDVLAPDYRFGDLTELAGISDAVEYVNYLNSHSWPVQSSQQNGPGFFQPQYSSQMLSILQRYLPVPQALIDQTGITPNDYYLNFSYYVGPYRDQNPQLFTDLDLEYDPVALTQELEQRIVDPTVAANKLFRKYSYLTRMYTTLSPEEMTKDPVFSFNPDLPEVSNVHEGRIIYYCGLIDNDSPSTTPAKVVTEDGWELAFPNGTNENPWSDISMPESLFTQVLREEGDAEVVGDNTQAIRAAIYGDGGSGGCSVGGDGSPIGALFFAGLALVALRRRRRQ